MKISPHFSLRELTTTSTGLPNEPDAASLERLRRLCVEVLEPIRAALGVPLRVTSGYRSAAVNAKIGGARTSQHMRGEAADVVPVGLSAEEAMTRIAEAVRSGRLVVDQAIVYRSGFLHLSRRTERNRGQLLRSEAAGGSGGPYGPWTGAR